VIRENISAIRNVFLALTMALALSACALPNVFKTVSEQGGDAVDQAYALVAVFDEVDAAALEFAQKSDTPQNVKDTLKKLRGPAAAAIPVIAEAAKTARDVLDRLNALENPSTADEAVAVIGVLNERFETYSPAVKQFLAYVNTL